jgi:hypothetical protein
MVTTISPEITINLYTNSTENVLVRDYDFYYKEARRIINIRSPLPDETTIISYTNYMIDSDAYTRASNGFGLPIDAFHDALIDYTRENGYVINRGFNFRCYPYCYILYKA